MPEVICLGIMVADLVGRPVRVIPEKGKLTLVDTMELHTGGCAVNTGRALSKLGIKTGVIGKLGADALGDFIIKELEIAGIDTRGIRRAAGVNTSATMVMVSEDGERSFIHYIGANATLRPEDIDWELVKGARLLHLAGSLVMPGFDGEPAAGVLKKAQEMGCLTSIDTAWDATGRWQELIDPCLSYTDVFLPSLDEARMLSGYEEPEAIVASFLERGVKIVGIKMGAAGSFVASAGESFLMPPFKVEAVDATGAGDAFVAGFLAGLVRGLDLKETARLANAVGALAVTAVGASSGIRGWEETKEFIAANYNNIN
ncbi:Carbohydrate kinase PfkB [Moorella glycerini]|uniref:Sugar kinase YdjH n=1 Tax=Neomoorella stamsii TaxID=1266720 RepID=A0A9X7J3W2_9FIRM|nr:MULTISPECIES: sugar kinase [Moorella]PRR72597.1 putative sugar kinase YdjH [Moorella stamsii]CEP67753.1 Carbohydrate kinase PfkB [Moorella glycerini]